MDAQVWGSSPILSTVRKQRVNRWAWDAIPQGLPSMTCFLQRGSTAFPKSVTKGQTQKILEAISYSDHKVGQLMTHFACEWPVPPTSVKQKSLFPRECAAFVDLLKICWLYLCDYFCALGSNPLDCLFFCQYCTVSVTIAFYTVLKLSRVILLTLLNTALTSWCLV